MNEQELAVPGKTLFFSDAGDAAAMLDSDAVRGLQPAVADERLKAIGPNELASSVVVPSWLRFLRQFMNPVVYLLILAILVSVAVWIAEGAHGFPFDAAVIAIIVLLNAVVGFLQEGKAADAVAALRDLTRQEATVIRDGVSQRIPARDLVPGDLVVLGDGDIVPADIRLTETASLRIAEAALTGESEPVTKSVGAVPESAMLGDRTSMAYSGTTVVAGRGRGLVAGTASATEVGKIAALIGETEVEKTPLQIEIDLIGRTLGFAVILIAIVVSAALVVLDGLSSASELLAALLIGVSLAVAAVPEGLPAVLSMVLALGVQRMSKRNALIKRLVSVEALGSATVICSDKTGTLTRNEMTVRRVVVASGQVELSDIAEAGDRSETSYRLLDSPVEEVMEAIQQEVVSTLLQGALAGDAILMAADGDAKPAGEPTEAALLGALPKGGIDLRATRERYLRVDEIPFSAERKRMSVVLTDEEEGSAFLAAKGAPDVILPRCAYERRGQHTVPLDASRREYWERAIEGLAGQALRTLAIAHRDLGQETPASHLDESIEHELVLDGIVGIMDPPRQEAKDAIEVAHRAGIRVVMITGDHPSTARQIAAELGIGEPTDQVLTARELDDMTDRELGEQVALTNVYARVAPDHKLRIVRALSARGEVVGMTGDGVNDAPALKAANIGVAMGVTGTDVSKEAADMILADDNFATIVAAVEEGRAIFHNIRSFLRYLLSSNAGEVFTVFLGVVGASIIGLDASSDGPASPLLAVQILWINLLTDAAPALALGLDPPLAGLMERQPRRISDRMIDRRMQASIVVTGLTMALATLFMFDLQLPGGLIEGSRDLETARTSAFTVLVLAQLFNTLNARSETVSAKQGVFVNPWLLGAVALSLILQVCVVYIPLLNDAFGTVPLGVRDWLIATVLASTVLWVGEVRKWILRRTER